MDAHITISQALAEAAELLGRSGQVTPSLFEIVEVAERSVAGFEHASITLLHPDGRFETAAWTHPLALRLDNAQYALDEGPCLDAARGGQVLSVPGLRLEDRWPSYIPQAVTAGVQSHLSVKLTLGTQTTRASLNLYSTTTEDITREAEAMAELIGFYGISDPRNAREPMQRSPTMESLRVVGQALGIVMDRFDLDSNQAFDHLAESADRADRPLAQHAQLLVEEDQKS